MSPTRVGLWLIGWLAVGSTAAAQQAAPPKTIQIPRVTTAPKLDDYLGQEPRPGVAVSGFLQRNPKDLEPATERTTAYLSYDATNLYVGFVCDASNPALIRAHMAKREDVFPDDIVGVMFDTFLDKQRAYMFFINPLGIQADGVTSPGGDDFNFDTQWTSEGRLTPTGYVARIVIPFKSLRFPVTSSGDQRWGFTVMRGLPAKDEQDWWPGISNKLAGFMSQFAVMEGLTGISPGRNSQLIPYGTFARARFLDQGAARYTAQTEHRVGLDAKTVVHDALTLDFTLNPDFSQVESDDPQVTVNQRFEVFFPEKRPFFLENADYFSDTPQNLFFSRRIADPQFGARATGKFGHWATGAIVVDDRAPGRGVDLSDPASGDRTVDGVFRVRNDFGKESRVGGLLTTRTFGRSSNTVAAADTRIRMGPRWFAAAQLAHSSTTSLDGTATTTGQSLTAALSRSGREFSYSLNYADASPRFHTDLGFVPRLDYRQLTQFFQIRWYPKTGPILNFGPNSYTEATWNYTGDLQDWVVRLPFQIQFKHQTFLFARHAFISETIAGRQFRQREDFVLFGTDYLRWLSFNAAFSRGTRPNYYPSARITPFLGDYTDASVGITVRPASAIRIEEAYLYSRLDTRADSPGTGKVFSNPILRSRVSWQFTREWSLRAILDYNRLDADSSLIGLDRHRRAGADLLLTWLLHPGTAVYVGYTDGFDSLRIDPTAGVVPSGGPLASTGRQVFVKMSWLLRF